MIVSIISYAKENKRKENDHCCVAYNFIAFEIRIIVHHVDHDDHVDAQDYSDYQTKNQNYFFHIFMINFPQN